MGGGDAGRTWEVRSAAVKMAAAVTPLVSTGRASMRPRYHPTKPDPAPAPTALVLLLGGTKAGPARREGDPAGGHRGGGDGGLEEMRWERMWDQGEGPGPRRSGTRRRPPAWRAPAVTMAAAAAARGLECFLLAARCSRRGLGRKEGER